MDLQADVFPGAEGAADAAEDEPDPLLVEAEAGRDLLAVLVQPLRRHVQFDAGAIGVGDGDGGLEPEEGLVLHPDLVRALDDDVAGDRRVATPDALRPQNVAVGMDRRMRPVDGGLGVEQRFEHLVRDLDGGEGATTRLGMVGGHGGDRLADVTHDVGHEHGLVGGDQPVRRGARDVVGRDHGGDAVDLPRLRHVDGDDPGVGVGRPQGHAPPGAVDRHVRGEAERALGLDDAVGADRRVADAAGERAPGDGGGRAHPRRLSTATCWTASMRRP